MTPEQIAALQAQLAATQRELAFTRAGVTDPEDIVLANLYYDRLPAENRPPPDAWIAEGKTKGTLPRALASIFAAPVQPAAPAASTPAPAATPAAPAAPAAAAPAAPAATPAAPAVAAPAAPAAPTQPTATPTATPAPTQPAMSAQEIRRMTAEAARSGDWTKVAARQSEINAAAGVAPPVQLAPVAAAPA